MSTPTTFLLVIVAVVAASTGSGSCAANRPPGAASQPVRSAPIAGLGPAELRLGVPDPAEHRILLDARTLTQLRESAKNDTMAFRTQRRLCDEALEKTLPSGYQGFEWADAVAGLSLCFHATGQPDYAVGAGRYLEALLDDRYTVGDGKGGAMVVTHDSGYGIRTFGAYSALGYDWLRGTPGMTTSLRQRVLVRLEEWLTWYAEHGYLRDRPTANYYWGYLTALSFAGLAASGELSAADDWLELARDELAERALPAFRDELVGGGWPEGWQYGEYTALEVALVAQAFRTGAGVDIASRLPWLGELVAHHTHALLPDGDSVYDGGTWGEHPARPSALALTGVAIALDGTDDRRAAEARWMIAHALPRLTREQAWASLLADRPGTAEPQRASPASLHLAGQGLTFARSDWSDAAVWMSFQAGPWLAEDHQDKDQGHFELWRGSDALLVDGGDSEGSASINHNTILVDDGGRHLVYAPNQGVWGGDNVKTTRFGDDGQVLVVVGDIGEAYAPKCASSGCPERSVTKLLRTLVFVRPALLVVEDVIEVDAADTEVTWAAHVTTKPTLAGNLASAIVGGSRVDLRFIEGGAAPIVALREPTPSGEGPHRLNKPWGPMWRIEQPSPTGTNRRRFLSVISAAGRAASAPPVKHVVGVGIGGATIGIEGRGVAVLFYQGVDGEIALGRTDLVVVAGLTPRQRYRLTFVEAEGCKMTIRASEEAGSLAATAGGFVRVKVKHCHTQR